MDSSSGLPGAHWTLCSLLLENIWRKEPLTVLDNWSKCLTLEDQKLSLRVDIWKWHDCSAPGLQGKNQAGGEEHNEGS